MDSEADLFDCVETARLKLRCVRLSDAAQLSTMITPSVSRWVAAWPHPFSPEMARERIAGSRNAFVDGKALPCVVEHRLDGTSLGWIALTRQNTGGRRAMLGYWMGEAHQGCGYMREAAPAFVAHAFRSLNIDIIEAFVQPENKTSLAVLRDCGMKLVGERIVFAPARSKDELCLLYEALRTDI